MKQFSASDPLLPYHK